jgi:hypothetical protein
MALMCIDWPGSIQAGAAIAIVILTAWTLKVLRDYAADTKKIASASVKQIENSQMPFLAAVQVLNVGWVIRNQGFGPAINILYTGGDNRDRNRMMATEPLGAGEERPLHKYNCKCLCCLSSV